MNERLPGELFASVGDGEATAESWHGPFAEIGTRDSAQIWLTRLAAALPGVIKAVIVFENEQASALLRLAAWPQAQDDYSILEPAVEATMRTPRPTTVRPDDPEAAWLVALPVSVEGHVLGVVALAALVGDEAGARAILRKVEIALGWLIAHVLQTRVRHDEKLWGRSVFALDLLAAISDETKPHKAALVLANEVARALPADRVSVGYVRKGRVRLSAISSTAWFKRKSPAVAACENAMEEALDQLGTVVHPARATELRTVDAAHSAYAQLSSSRALMSVILARGGQPVGVLTAERRDLTPFEPKDVELAEAVADLAGPFLYLNRKQWRFLSGRAPDLLRRGLVAVFGPRHPSLKLGLILLGLFLAATLVLPATFRIGADAVLEGAEQRAATMPFAGFIAEAPKRAGDVVKAGDLLIRLDDKDLRLENLRWVAEYAQLQQQKRKALVGEERAEIAILEAQIEQARAQIDLSAAMLARTEVVSPIDGVVISGDWSQQLGTPVEKGKVLMEVAPLGDYRIILKVDEGDIQYMKPGQTGTLLLAGRTDSTYRVSVTRVTSVANAEEGRNLFRVEATPLEALPDLRPGMDGVAKIEIGDSTLAWTWTRGLLNWVRQFYWRWTP
jgi:hypothetical protein